MTGLYSERTVMRGRVGMVIPTWFPSDLPIAEAERLLYTTLTGASSCVNAEDLVVVSDGSPVASAAAVAVRGRLDEAWDGQFLILEIEENEGKGAALEAGICELLERRGTPLEWITVRDADGDHLMDDLPHLYRAGTQLAEENPDRPVCVIGRRNNVHAPLGWLRGELELLLNEALVEGVAYALAGTGRVWDTRYLAERAPDLQSGYKLYSRAAAQLAVTALQDEAATYPDLHLMRTGMEIVPFVTVAVEGGVFAEVERKTFYDQPVTSYGKVDLAQFYGSKLAWALLRCGVPADQALILLDGALARRPLFTDPTGREIVLRMRRRVLGRLDASYSGEAPPARMPRML